MDYQPKSPNKFANVAWDALRWFYGIWFIGFAIAMVVFFNGHIPGSSGSGDAVPGSITFLRALNASGFIEPMLIVVYIIAGAALLRARTAPLGLVMIAAPVAVVVAFHVLDTHLYLWAGIWTLGTAALFWRFRARLASLWT